MQVILFSVNLKIALIDEYFVVFRVSLDDLFMGLDQPKFSIKKCLIKVSTSDLDVKGIWLLREKWRGEFVQLFSQHFRL